MSGTAASAPVEAFLARLALTGMRPMTVRSRREWQCSPAHVSVQVGQHLRASGVSATAQPAAALRRHQLVPGQRP
jgi:hypothetical protein